MAYDRLLTLTQAFSRTWSIQSKRCRIISNLRTSDRIAVASAKSNGGPWDLNHDLRVPVICGVGARFLFLGFLTRHNHVIAVWI